LKPIIHQALIEVYPEYFNLTNEDRQEFRTSDSDVHERVWKFVAQELGIDLTKDELTNTEALALNDAMTGYQGIGFDPFLLNEFHWDDEVKAIKSSKGKRTLWDYNLDTYNRRQVAMDLAPSDSISYGEISDWGRLIVDDKFYYCNLDSSDYKLVYTLHDFYFDYIDTKIPHERQLKPKGLPDIDGKLSRAYTVETQANGLESELHLMDKFSHEYLDDRKKKGVDLGDVVFLGNSIDDGGDPFLDFVFGNLKVLKQIRFTSFWSDCVRLKAPDNNVLHEFLAEEVKLFKSALDNYYIDLIGP